MYEEETRLDWFFYMFLLTVVVVIVDVFEQARNLYRKIVCG